jgi:hypothetical protein
MTDKQKNVAINMSTQHKKECLAKTGKPYKIDCTRYTKNRTPPCEWDRSEKKCYEKKREREEESKQPEQQKKECFAKTGKPYKIDCTRYTKNRTPPCEWDRDEKKCYEKKREREEESKQPEQQNKASKKKRKKKTPKKKRKKTPKKKLKKTKLAKSGEELLQMIKHNSAIKERDCPVNIGELVVEKKALRKLKKKAKRARKEFDILHHVMQLNRDNKLGIVMRCQKKNDKIAVWFSTGTRTRQRETAKFESTGLNINDGIQVKIKPSVDNKPKSKHLYIRFLFPYELVFSTSDDEQDVALDDEQDVALDDEQDVAQNQPIQAPELQVMAEEQPDDLTPFEKRVMSLKISTDTLMPADLIQTLFDKPV